MAEDYGHEIKRIQGLLSKITREGVRAILDRRSRDERLRLEEKGEREMGGKPVQLTVLGGKTTVLHDRRREARQCSLFGRCDV